jgi:putative transcriptional regulator
MIRALCALLVLCGSSWSTLADDAKRVTAIFLVARAELPDPRFKDSVVLVMNQMRPVPVGVIINKPTRITVSQLFPELERLAGLDDKVYFGGPVDDVTEVLDGVYFSTNGELLRELLGRDKPVEGLRIFIGYSSWAPGQLESEVSHGDWNLAPANASAIFDGKPERRWLELHRPGAGNRASRRNAEAPGLVAHRTDHLHDDFMCHRVTAARLRVKSPERS